MLDVEKVQADEIVPCLCCKKLCLPPEPLCHDHLIAKSFLAMIGVTNDCYDTVTHRQKIMKWIEMLPNVFKPADLIDRIRFLKSAWRKYQDKREALHDMKSALNLYQDDHKLLVEERDNLLCKIKNLEKDLSDANTQRDDLEKKLEVVSKSRDNFKELTETANKSIEVLMSHVGPASQCSSAAEVNNIGTASQGSSETEVKNIGTASQGSSETEEVCDPFFCAWNTDPASVESTRNSQTRKDVDCLSCVFVPCKKHRVFTGTLAVNSDGGLEMLYAS